MGQLMAAFHPSCQMQPSVGYQCDRPQKGWELPFAASCTKVCEGPEVTAVSLGRHQPK